MTITVSSVNFLSAYVDNPTVQWSTSGETQTAFRVRFFTSDQYGVGGFDPATSPATWDSGIQSSPPYGHAYRPFGVHLPDYVYRAYVSALGTTGVWSAWVSGDYVQDRSPSAPILSSPVSGATLDTLPGFTISWQFQHPDPFARQTAYALRRKVGAGAYSYWRASDSTWQSTIQWNTSTATQVTIPSTVWPNGSTYSWSVATQDGDGDQGPFAGDSLLTSNAKPSASAVSPSGTVTTTCKPTVTWTYTDAESNPQEKYQVRIVTTSVGFNDPNAYDSGVVSSSSAAHPLTKQLANDNVAKTIYVRVFSNKQWSNYATASMTVNVPAPSAPGLTASFSSLLGLESITAMGQTNRLTANQASLETDTTGWSANVGCTIARSTAQHSDGAASLALTATGTTGMSARTDIPTWALVVGRQFSATAEVKAGTTARSCRVNIEWLTAANATISTSNGGSVTNNNTGFTVLTCTATAPATAAKARIWVEVLTTTVVGEVHYFDKIGFNQSLLGTAIAWSPGGYFQVGVGMSFLIEYSDDAGTTWTALAGSTSIVSDFQEVASFSDYTVVPRTPRIYRATSLLPLPTDSTQLIGSLPSSTVSTGTWTPTMCVLVAPDTPALSAQVRVDPNLRLKRPNITGKFQVEGKANAVMLSDGILRGREGQIMFRALSKAEEQSLNALLLPGQKLLLKDPVGEVIYFQVEGDIERNYLRAADSTLPRRWAYELTANVVEVDA